MTIPVPENIIIFVAIILIVSLMANAAFVGLLIAYINTERAVAQRKLRSK